MAVRTATISSFPTFIARQIAPSHGLQCFRAASMRSLRPRRTPAHWGPRRPLPPEKQKRSTPSSAKRRIESKGGMPAASSTIIGTPRFFVIGRARSRRSSVQVVYTMAVSGPRAAARSSTWSTSTRRAPTRRIELSQTTRPPSRITSPFRPVVSGSCQTAFGSSPPMQAAVPAAMAPAAPEVTIPDSAPESSASFRPAASCSSNMSTKCFPAASAARRTSGSWSEPLR